MSLITDVPCKSKFPDLILRLNMVKHDQTLQSQNMSKQQGHSASDAEISDPTVLVKNVLAWCPFDGLLMPKAFAANTALNRMKPCGERDAEQITQLHQELPEVIRIIRNQ